MYSYQKALSLPHTDIKEDVTGYTIELEISGYSEKDIDIQFDKKELSISSKQEDEKKDKNVP